MVGSGGGDVSWWVCNIRSFPIRLRHCDFVKIIKSFDNLHTPFETKLYCRQQCQSKVSDFVDLLAGIVA